MAEEQEKRKQNSSLINRQAVARYVKDTGPSLRYHKFTRISSELFDHLDSQMRRWLDGIIKHAPSTGKTLYPGVRISKNEPNEGGENE